MKILTNTSFEKDQVLTVAEAVQYIAERAENRSEGGQLERARMRADALEGVLGRLIAALVDNGALRPDQIECIFDYDVSAEA